MYLIIYSRSDWIDSIKPVTMESRKLTMESGDWLLIPRATTIYLRPIIRYNDTLNYI